MCTTDRRARSESPPSSGWKSVFPAKIVTASVLSTSTQKSLVDGWVSMEDNEQCNSLLAEEVNQLMDLEVLCDLKQLSIENDKDNDE